MPITINPICRKPRMQVKLKNFYLRKLHRELLENEKNIVAENLKKASEVSVLLCKEQKAREEKIGTSILINRMNIRKILPIFPNIN